MLLRVFQIDPHQIPFCCSDGPVTKSPLLQLLSVDNPPTTRELDYCNGLPPFLPVLVFYYLVNNVPTIISPEPKDPDVVYREKPFLLIAITRLETSFNMIYVSLRVLYALVQPLTFDHVAPPGVSVPTDTPRSILTFTALGMQTRATCGSCVIKRCSRPKTESLIGQVAVVLEEKRLRRPKQPVDHAR